MNIKGNSVNLFWAPVFTSACSSDCLAAVRRILPSGGFVCLLSIIRSGAQGEPGRAGPGCPGRGTSSGKRRKEGKEKGKTGDAVNPCQLRRGSSARSL